MGTASKYVNPDATFQNRTELNNDASVLQANMKPCQFAIEAPDGAGLVRGAITDEDSNYLPIAMKSETDALESGKEDASNKENTTIDTSTTKYPTVNLLKTGLDSKEDVTNKKTDLTDNSDTFYPSVKAVNDGLALKQDEITDNITGTGSAGKLAKFTAGGVIGDSIVSEIGTELTVDGDATVDDDLTVGGKFALNTSISATDDMVVGGAGGAGNTLRVRSSLNDSGTDNAMVHFGMSTGNPNRYLLSVQGSDPIFSVTGTITIAHTDLTVGGDATIDDDLTVGGETVLTGVRNYGAGGSSVATGTLLSPTGVRTIKVLPTANEFYRLQNGVEGQHIIIKNVSNPVDERLARIYNENASVYLGGIMYAKPTNIVHYEYLDGEWSVI